MFVCIGLCALWGRRTENGCALSWEEWRDILSVPTHRRRPCWKSCRSWGLSYGKQLISGEPKGEQKGAAAFSLSLGCGWQWRNETTSKTAVPLSQQPLTASGVENGVLQRLLTVLQQPAGWRLGDVCRIVCKYVRLKFQTVCTVYFERCYYFKSAQWTLLFVQRIVVKPAISFVLAVYKKILFFFISTNKTSAV